MQRKEPFYSFVNNNAAGVILERRWGIYGFASIYDAIPLKYFGWVVLVGWGRLGMSHLLRMPYLERNIIPYRVTK